MLTTDLPIGDILDELKSVLASHDRAVLAAPPGAGKTTVVPLALAAESWLGHRKILILEPRRIATRAAAHRMASLSHEKPGQTVGYRMRLETVVSEYTKIEVITEGILVRMLQEDPSLEEVGLVIFDEFHERNLDSDLALALCLKAQELFREEDPLKLLVMSATIDVTAIAGLMEGAPVIQSEGRIHPVDVHFGKAAQPRERIVDRLVPAIVSATKDHLDSNILAFLPGQGEINRTLEGLTGKLASNIDVHPMYGNLPIEQQQAAINPAPAGRRKVVLATNIAETSLTIDGVDVVVDTGLERVPVFDPVTGMTRLSTQRISDASSTQRAGRAGRLKPGHCYRLWSKDQQLTMARHTTPEIQGADLAPLALQLLQWGISDPGEVKWLDQPPTGAFNQAKDLLHSLGAIDGTNLTPHGDAMASFGTHPRLAHMLIKAKEYGVAETAALLAAIFADRDPFTDQSPDMAYRIDVLRGVESAPNRHRGWFRRTHQQAEQFTNQLARVDVPRQMAKVPDDIKLGYLLALAYPDRIARRRHSGGYQLANGRSAKIDNSHFLSKAEWLAVAEVGGIGKQKGDHIRSAAKLDTNLFDNLLQDLIEEKTVVDWDKKAGRFVAEEQRTIGALVLSKSKLDNIAPEEKSAALIRYIEQNGIETLNWNDEVKQLQARVELLRQIEGDVWPNLTPEYLVRTLGEWLTPYIGNVTKLADFKRLDLADIFKALLPYEQQQQLEAKAPQRITVPSGSSYRIDYTENPPVLAVKLQEMFGQTTTPAVAGGSVPLKIHLLSPAGRPLQVTQDLEHFWQNTYPEVKKEMKGRYPKHPWPDDPLAAEPTRYTNRRK